MSQKAGVQFQKVIEAVEALPPDDQAVVLDIIYRRLIQLRRREIVREVAETRTAYRQGDFQRGTVAELMKDLSG